MFLTVTLGLLLFQDPDAELLKRLLPVVDRAGDLDPVLRAEAAAEAVGICSEQAEPLAVLARARKVPAMIVLALAGKSDGTALLRMPDRIARQVACDRITVTKELLPDVLQQLDARDPGLRLAACRALGRIEDPGLRQTLSSTLGHGMRRAGFADLHFALVSSMWRGTCDSRLFLINDVDPERAGLAIAALCNLPDVVVTESFSPSLLRALENEKIDRSLRSLLIRSTGRRSPWALCPLLAIRDRKLRSEIVDVLDRRIADPLLAPSLHEAWKDARAKKLDDGKTAAQPLSLRIEAWLKRICGEGVAPENVPEWIQANYRTHVDRQADAAVRRGAAGLLKLCEKTGPWRNSPGGLVGLSAFAAYALLKADVAPADTGVARCLDALLEREPEGIYSTSLTAMALSAAVARNAPRKERLERRLQTIADILVSSQLKSGGWSYIARVYADQSIAGWSYDLSNTQFAILGLRAAANAGSKIPRTTWERALLLLEKTQAEDGGWTYQGTDSAPYNRMTAAGATSWILCRISLDENLAPEAAAETPRIRHAMRWLERATDASQMPRQPDYYLLYSLERLCMVSRIEKLGTHDWYAEGASILLRSQGQDGLWIGSHGAVADTCMALLFLRKAFIARPETPTESAQRGASPEQALDVFEHRSPSMFQEGVKDIRLDRDPKTSFILIIVASEADAKRLGETLGREIDGVPLRFVVE